MYYANLSYFDPNPWQPRQRMAEGALGELAENIRSLKDVRPQTRGLLQLPAARLVHAEDQTPVLSSLFFSGMPKDAIDVTDLLEASGYRLQLGIGHRRHAAFVSLAVNGDADYEMLPFETAFFTDEEMFKIALSENVARADLSPVEVAGAMARYRDEFGKSSKEIGELFGMSDSAVRNKMRLLELPEEPRQALEEGRMSEGAGRMLLSLYALPEHLRANAEGNYDKNTKPSEIIKDAIQNGALASNIDTRVAILLDYFGKDLSRARWKWTDVFEAREGIEHPDCKTCPMHITRGNKHICGHVACFNTKGEVWTEQYLQRAQAVVNIAPLEEDNAGYYQISTFSWHSKDEALASARAAGCPNLRLYFHENHGHSSRDNTLLNAEGFPNIEVVCCKRSGHCACRKAADAGVELAATSPQAILEGNGDDQAPQMTEKELTRIRKEIAAKKKVDKQEIEAIIEEVRHRVHSAICTLNIKAWQKVANSVHYSLGKEKTWDELLLALAHHLADAEFIYTPDSVNANLTKANRYLKELGLSEIEPQPVSMETPALPDGQPLIEVLAPAEYNANWLEN